MTPGTEIRVKQPPARISGGHQKLQEARNRVSPRQPCDTDLGRVVSRTLREYISVPSSHPSAVLSSSRPGELIPSHTLQAPSQDTNAAHMEPRPMCSPEENSSRWDHCQGQPHGFLTPNTVSLFLRVDPEPTDFRGDLHSSAACRPLPWNSGKKGPERGEGLADSGLGGRCWHSCSWK